MPLWDPAPWHRHLAQGAMLAAYLLVALAAFTPNPLSFGGWRNDRFDPAHPGIVGLVRHPLIPALALWALGHLSANGDLAHALMFGGFAGFALFGMAMIDRRRRRDLGTEGWCRLAHGAAHLRSFRAARVASGLVVWFVLAHLHPLLIGPTVWP